MTSGLAMKMKLELSSLARRHRVEPKLSIALPLHLPSPRSVLITGVACADSIDQERMRFAPRSLTFLPWKLAAAALSSSRSRRRDRASCLGWRPFAPRRPRRSCRGTALQRVVDRGDDPALRVARPGRSAALSRADPARRSGWRSASGKFVVASCDGPNREWCTRKTCSGRCRRRVAAMSCRLPASLL